MLSLQHYLHELSFVLLLITGTIEIQQSLRSCINIRWWQSNLFISSTNSLDIEISTRYFGMSKIWFTALVATIQLQAACKFDFFCCLFSISIVFSNFCSRHSVIRFRIGKFKWTIVQRKWTKYISICEGEFAKFNIIIF